MGESFFRKEKEKMFDHSHNNVRQLLDQSNTYFGTVIITFSLIIRLNRHVVSLHSFSQFVAGSQGLLWFFFCPNQMSQ